MEQKSQAEQIIQKLQLEGHVQGGFFKQTYRGPIVPGTDRRTMTLIYYLVTKNAPQCNWRSIKSDQISCHIKGGSFRFFFIYPDGKFEQHILSGNVLNQGEVAQLLIPGGVWSTAYLDEGEYGLCTESVSPGFQYEDMKIASTDEMMERYPQYKEKLEKIKIKQTILKKNE